MLTSVSALHPAASLRRPRSATAAPEAAKLTVEECPWGRVRSSAQLSSSGLPCCIQLFSIHWQRQGISTLR